jgi:hypothetical protein
LLCTTSISLVLKTIIHRQSTSLTLLAVSFPFAGFFDCKDKPSAKHPRTPNPTIITTPSTPPKLHLTNLTLTFSLSPLLKGLLPCNSAAPAPITVSTPSPTILPTVLPALSTALSLDDDDSSDFFGLTFLAALLVTFFAASLALGAAFFAAALGAAFFAAFFTVSFDSAAAFFASAVSLRLVVSPGPVSSSSRQRLWCVGRRQRWLLSLPSFSRDSFSRAQGLLAWRRSSFSPGGAEDWVSFG